MEQLINEIKLKLIDALNLDGMTPADLERNYGIRLANPQEGKKVFQSVAVMADYVAANRKK